MTREYVTVALNGDGGDEDFAGYQRYWLDPLANLYLQAPPFLTRNLIPSIARRLPDRSNRPVGQSFVNGLKRLEQLPRLDRRASILRWGSYFAPWQRQQLWKEEHWKNFRADNAESLLAESFDKASGSFLDRTLYTDLHNYLPGDLLVKADRMTMAASLEGRSPFLDHDIVEWAARLPDSLKVRGRNGKYLLKKAFANDLPENVQSHGKQGFGIPLAAWFRGPLADWSRELLLGADARGREDEIGTGAPCGGGEACGLPCAPLVGRRRDDRRHPGDRIVAGAGARRPGDAVDQRCTAQRSMVCGERRAYLRGVGTGQEAWRWDLWSVPKAGGEARKEPTPCTQIGRGRTASGGQLHSPAPFCSVVRLLARPTCGCARRSSGAAHDWCGGLGGCPCRSASQWRAGTHYGRRWAGCVTGRGR